MTVRMSVTCQHTSLVTAELTWINPTFAAKRTRLTATTLALQRADIFHMPSF